MNDRNGMASFNCGSTSARFDTLFELATMSATLVIVDVQ